MEFRFKSDITPLDFWKLSMSHTYHSIVGVCNIVFTVAMFALTYHFWNKTDNDIFEVLMILGCALFTVIQPVVVYMRAKAQVALVPQNMEFLFDEKGLHVTVGEQSESIPWKKIKSITKERNMMIIRSGERHGYMITNRAMGAKKDAFFNFAQLKME